MARLAYYTVAPEAFGLIRELSTHLEHSEIGGTLLHLVYLRISQINGCSYCVDLHWRDARAAGVDERALNGVLLWRSMPFFSERERAALAWAEAVTTLRDQQVSGEEFEHAHRHFSEREMAELTFAIAHMNALNRIAIAFHHVPVIPQASPVTA